MYIAFVEQKKYHWVNYVSLMNCYIQRIKCLILKISYVCTHNEYIVGSAGLRHWSPVFEWISQYRCLCAGSTVYWNTYYMFIIQCFQQN